MMIIRATNHTTPTIFKNLNNVESEGPHPLPSGRIKRPEIQQNHDDSAHILKTSLRFEVNQDTHEVMLMLIDDLTGKILRHIPINEPLGLSNSVPTPVGILVNTQG